MRLRCTFVPQAWINNYAVTVDPQGPTTWEMEYEALREPKPHSYESDALRYSSAAPEWVREWSGPFEVEYEVVTEGESPTAKFNLDAVRGELMLPQDGIYFLQWADVQGVAEQNSLPIDLSEDEMRVFKACIESGLSCWSEVVELALAAAVSERSKA